MNSILLYLIQSSVSLVIFYVFYELLFKREAYFGFNRFYLLATIFISLFLPTITFSIPELFLTESSNVLIAAPVYSLVEYTLSEVTIYGDSVALSNVSWYSNLSFFDIIMLIYFTGVTIALLFFVFRFYQLSNLFKRSKVNMYRGLRVIFTTSGTSVFSFFNYVFIDKKLLESNQEIVKIIEHEKIHIRQKHSVDIIIAEIISIIQWYNPIVYILKKSLKENHEFIADNNVITTYPDIMAYSKLLIENSSIVKTNILTHNFSYSLLKRRLFMIKKTKSPLRFSLKLVVVVFALSMVFFACSGPAIKSNEFGESVYITGVKKDMHHDSILMATYTNQNFDSVYFLVTLGKERITQMELFNDKEELIGKFMNGKYGPGSYITTWTPIESSAISIDNYSYTLKADGKEYNGVFTNTKKIVYKPANEDGIFTEVEQMPEFEGGMEALMNYLSENITYPQEAKEKGIHGKVFINFVINVDGSIDNVKVLRGIGGGCDEEAVRVVSSMPNWSPGMQRGKAVRVSYNIPIKFTLDDKVADSVFTLAEVMPEFPGGRNELLAYIGANIKYPEAAKKAGLQGRVFVSFVVETDGSVSGAKILRGIGAGCDEEALRVVNSMPIWSPGLVKGLAVRVQYNLPIKYALN